MRSKTEFYINNVYYLLILGSMILSILDALGNFTSIIRVVSIGFSLVFVIIFILRSSLFNFNRLFIIIFIWILYNLIWLALTYNDYYLSVIFQQAILLTFIWSASSGDSPLESIESLKPYIIFYQLMAVFFLIISIRPVFTTSLFAFSFFTLAMVSGTWKKVGICFIYILVFWYSEERSRALALIFVAIGLIVLPILNRSFYKITYWAMISQIVLIPKIYTWLYSLPGSNYWNIWIREISGKNLFSGRQHLWGYLENQLVNNQIFGAGGKLVGGVFSVDNIYGMSSHNLELFLRGQGGYFLLFLFVIFLYFIWMRFYDHLSNPYVLVGAAYLIGLLVRSSFDLVLMANNFVDSLILWLPIIIALSTAQSISKENRKLHLKSVPS